MIRSSRPRAYALGFVNVVTEPGEALDGALALAERIAVNAPLSVQACLDAVNGLARADDDAGWDATTHAIAAIAGTDDVKEGMTAFFEKRAPEWTGR